MGANWTRGGSNNITPFFSNLKIQIRIVISIYGHQLKLFDRFLRFDSVFRNTLWMKGERRQRKEETRFFKFNVEWSLVLKIIFRITFMTDPKSINIWKRSCISNTYFKFSNAEKGDPEWEETKSDAQNQNPMKFYIDIVLRFFLQLHHIATLELPIRYTVGYTKQG